MENKLFPSFQKHFMHKKTYLVLPFGLVFLGQISLFIPLSPRRWCYADYGLNSCCSGFLKLLLNFLDTPSSEVGTVLQRKLSSADEMQLFCNIFIYSIILQLLFENVLNSSSRLLPKEKIEDADCTKAFFTQKEIGSCWHDLLLTNLCRLLLISLSSSQYLQTVVWSIPRKIWGKWSWQVCGSPATPLFKDKYRVCPLTVPPPFSVNSQARAADRSGVVLAASSKHSSMKQQVTDMKTFIWSQKHFATSSFAAGGQALPTVSPTRLLGSLTQSAHLVRMNAKKEGCSSVFLTSWLIAFQLCWAAD